MNMSESEDPVIRTAFWWENSEILRLIFRNMKLEHLQSVRLVCHLWNFEATKSMDSKFRICFEPSSSSETMYSQLQSLVTSHRLHHYLFVSLIDESWFCHMHWNKSSRRKEILHDVQWWHPMYIDIQETYLRQGNNVEQFSLIRRFYRPEPAALIVLLHIELAIVNERDNQILLEMLHTAQSLQIFFVDLMLLDEDVFRSICLETSCFKSLQTRSHAVWLKMFPNIECLGSTHAHNQGMISSSDDMKFFCDSIKELIKECPDECKFLKELVVPLRHSPNFLATIPINLSHVTLICGRKPSPCKLYPDLELVLQRHAATLKTLALYWTRINYGVFRVESLSEATVTLPPTMPVLTRLTIVSDELFGEQKSTKRRVCPVSNPYYDARPCEDDHCWQLGCRIPFVLAAADILLIRHLLLDGPAELKLRLPSLNSLCISLSYENDQRKIFRYIFPSKQVDGTPLRITQLKYLAVSLPASCQSEHVTRLHSIFPELDVLKHLRMSGLRMYFVCEHRRYSDGSFTHHPHEERYQVIGTQREETKLPKSIYHIYTGLKEESSEYENFFLY